jgi:phosphoribosylformylglycinamidine synthase
MSASVGVLVFPGSNCDHDAYHVARHILGLETRFIWHKEEDLGGVDLVVVPGGFSYGDYLRSGAIARFSPIMREVVRFAEGGGLVLGICNGFQILCESGLLPGALLRNASLRFVCRHVHLRVETDATPFTLGQKGDVLRVPIAHGDGNYYADPETLDRLEREDRVVFRYCDGDGHVVESANPNGSSRNVAGVLSAGRNVLGMMPHPERCSEAILGRPDGIRLFESVVRHLAGVPA